MVKETHSLVQKFKVYLKSSLNSFSSKKVNNSVFFTQFSAAAHSKMTERVFRSVEVGNSIVINNRKPSQGRGRGVVKVNSPVCATCQTTNYPLSKMVLFLLFQWSLQAGDKHYFFQKQTKKCLVVLYTFTQPQPFLLIDFL